MMMHTLVTWLLVAAAAAPGAAAWGLSPPAPRFAVVPSDKAREGKGYVERLKEESSVEGFLDRVLGINCFTQAVSELTNDCRRMEQEQKTRLALRLANCQLGVQSGESYPCSHRQPLKECIEVLPERAYALFVEFLTHADTMCLYIQNQNFEKYTENMLNRLSEGAGYAREQLAAVARSTSALEQETSGLTKKAQDALGLLQQHTELEKESLKMQKEARAEALAYFSSLDAKQQRGLELQDAALLKQAALEQGQQVALSLLADAQDHLGGLFQLVEGRAAELAAAAGRQADAQRALAGELGGLLDSSRGIRSAVDVVIGYQQRSDSVLMRLLGKSYTLEDVAFYGAGVLAAMAAGVSPATAKAKLPVMALMGVCLVGERLLLDRLHMWMDISDSGEIMLNLPLAGWLPLLSAASQPLQLNFKWAVRRMAMALGASMLLYSLLTFRDFERESFTLLRQLEEDQRRRHEQYIELVQRHKVELAALLGGAAQHGSGSAAARIGLTSTGTGKKLAQGAGRPGDLAVAAGVRGQWMMGAEGVQLAAAEVAMAGSGERLVLRGAGLALPPSVHAQLALIDEEEEDEDLEADGQGQRELHREGEHSERAAMRLASLEQPEAPAPNATGRKAAAAAKKNAVALLATPAVAPPTRKRGAAHDAEATAAAGGSNAATTATATLAGSKRGGASRRGQWGATPAAADEDAMAVDSHGNSAAPGRKQSGKRTSASNVSSAAPKRTRKGTI